MNEICEHDFNDDSDKTYMVCEKQMLKTEIARLRAALELIALRTDILSGSGDCHKIAKEALASLREWKSK